MARLTRRYNRILIKGYKKLCKITLPNVLKRRQDEQYKKFKKKIHIIKI